METSYLREFLTLADCLSFSDAAERLYLSQSTLSKRIHALEQHLGVSLFLRSTRSVQLSEAGAALLPFARQIDELCRSGEAVLDQLKHGADRQLTIAAMQNPEYYDMAKYIVSFQVAHPELSISLVEANESGLYEMFMKRQVNVFPSYENFRGGSDYIFMPLAESVVTAIFRRDHPLAGQECVTLSQLNGQRLLLPSRGGSLTRLIQAAFQQEGITPSVLYEGSSIGCIDLVKAGMGVSLHGKGFADTLSRDQAVSTAAIEPPIHFVYGLTHRPVQELFPAERIYLEHMRQFAL
ncbi:MAG: LysR family transcriptional regulator [Oscillospiraceae bacterium]|nr:LysR family transcriptional regulator [Oscillospiraceae bacterium]